MWYFHVTVSICFFKQCLTLLNTVMNKVWTLGILVIRNILSQVNCCLCACISVTSLWEPDVTEELAYFPRIRLNIQININAAPPLHLMKFQWDVSWKQPSPLAPLHESALVPVDPLFGLFCDDSSRQCVILRVVSQNSRSIDPLTGWRRLQMAQIGLARWPCYLYSSHVAYAGYVRWASGGCIKRWNVCLLASVHHIKQYDFLLYMFVSVLPA